MTDRGSGNDGKLENDKNTGGKVMTTQKENKQNKNTELQIVIFRLRDEEFAVEVTSVIEISRIPNITHIPQAPGFIEGVINLRGKVIPVIDLAKQFGLPDEEESPKTARIVVVEIQDQHIGLMVDEVPEVLRVSQNLIEETPEIFHSKIHKDYIQGVVKLEERLVVLLNLDNVLAPQEMDVVKEVK
jgi:purine-binding chemotaxis protein CheW